MLVIVCAATPAVAGGSVVPEIDGGSLATGLGLLSGGLLILRARWGATGRQRPKED
jgi:hypothetical protein